MRSEDYHVGVYGLGVMGSNIALNFASKKAQLSSSASSSSAKASQDFIYASNWDGDSTLVDKFLDKAEDEGLADNVKAYKDLSTFFDAMKSPRVVFIMVTSGAAVDSSIASFMPFLQPGDIIIDGGNEW
jgi:6-phosphogluconate dehydrogenase